jgi:hypothetical protein
LCLASCFTVKTENKKTKEHMSGRKRKFQESFQGEVVRRQVAGASGHLSVNAVLTLVDLIDDDNIPAFLALYKMERTKTAMVALGESEAYQGYWLRRFSRLLPGVTGLPQAYARLVARGRIHATFAWLHFISRALATLKSLKLRIDFDNDEGEIIDQDTIFSQWPIGSIPKAGFFDEIKVNFALNGRLYRCTADLEKVVFGEEDGEEVEFGEEDDEEVEFGEEDGVELGMWTGNWQPPTRRSLPFLSISFVGYETDRGEINMDAFDRGTLRSNLDQEQLFALIYAQ